MQYRFFWISSLLITLSALVSVVDAQYTPVPTSPSADTSAPRPVVIDYAELYERIVTDSVVEQRLTGEVELAQDSVLFYSDAATILNDSFVMARGNVVIRQNDSINVFADSLEYFATRQLAFLYGNVVLVNGRQRLFTDSLRYDLSTKVARYASRAKLTDGEAQLSSLRGVYDVNAHYARFADSVFVVRPDFNMLADTLGFDTEQRIVYFEGPTVMATPDSRVYTEDGFYRLDDTTGRFNQNAQVARGTQRAIADTLWYYGKERKFIGLGNARFTDRQQRARGRRIEYDERKNRTLLIGDAVINDGAKRVAGERIDYDGTTRVFNSGGRIALSEPPYLLDADSLWFDELGGLAHVSGDVLWRDTLGQRTIQAEFLDYRKPGDYVIAYGNRPVFTTVVDGDSLFLSADTLLTYREPVLSQVISGQTAPDSTIANPDSTANQQLGVQPDSVGGLRSIPLDSIVGPSREDLVPLSLGDTSLSLKPVAIPSSVADSSQLDSLLLATEDAPLPDSVRRLQAFHNVRIYKSNMQAVSDSMTYSDLDSTFVLYRTPVLWSDTSQFLADTIAIRLRNEVIDEVQLLANAFVINSPDELFYNQIKGRRVNAHFKAGQIDRMFVRGNAESVYYIQDEAKAYVGVNHVKSARMKMMFAEGELSDIYFYEQPEGEMQPLAPRGQQPKLLEDFRWEQELRPASKADVQ